MVEILVADDHPLFRYAITDFVERNIADTKTTTCTDLDAAIEVADENPDIDLVLLDLNMPGMDGLNGIVRFRNQFPEIPIVIVSAEEDKNVVLQAFTYGAVGFITKSSSCEQIVAHDPFCTCLTSKPMPMHAGPRHGYPPRPNGSMQSQPMLCT